MPLCALQLFGHTTLDVWFLIVFLPYSASVNIILWYDHAPYGKSINTLPIPLGRIYLDGFWPFELQ